MNAARCLLIIMAFESFIKKQSYQPLYLRYIVIYNGTLKIIYRKEVLTAKGLEDHSNTDWQIIQSIKLLRPAHHQNKEQNRMENLSAHFFWDEDPGADWKDETNMEKWRKRSWKRDQTKQEIVSDTACYLHCESINQEMTSKCHQIKQQTKTFTNVTRI